MNADPIYRIDDEQGVVVCIITGCKDDVYKDLEGMLPRYLNLEKPKNSKAFDGKSFYIHNSYKGIAKCAPEDEFDETYGMDLAFERAYAKYMKAKYNTISRAAKYLQKASEELNIHLFSDKKWETNDDENGNIVDRYGNKLV